MSVNVEFIIYKSINMEMKRNAEKWTIRGVEDGLRNALVQHAANAGHTVGEALNDILGEWLDQIDPEPDIEERVADLQQLVSEQDQFIRKLFLSFGYDPINGEK